MCAAQNLHLAPYYNPVDLLRARDTDPYSRGSLYLDGVLAQLRLIGNLQETSKENCRNEIQQAEEWYDQQRSRQAELEAAAKIIRWYQIRKKIQLARGKTEYRDANLELYHSTRKISNTLSRSLLPRPQRVSATLGQDISPNGITQGIASVEDNCVSETETATRVYATIQELDSSDDPVRRPRASTTEPIEQGPMTPSPRDTESATDPVQTLSSVRSGASPTSPSSTAGISYFISCHNYHNYNAGVYYSNSTSTGLVVSNDRSNNDNSVQNHMSPPEPLP
ncbi:hypothetical protein PAXINDRAFT_167047 [Paxillus involutus ATCC 200175]|nr:hypothetical protein PAXINDRAFT_167047 [Paxillus involutus ATCC 200175]